MNDNQCVCVVLCEWRVAGYTRMKRKIEAIFGVHSPSSLFGLNSTYRQKLTLRLVEASHIARAMNYSHQFQKSSASNRKSFNLDRVESVANTPCSCCRLLTRASDKAPRLCRSRRIKGPDSYQLLPVFFRTNSSTAFPVSREFQKVVLFHSSELAICVCFRDEPDF